jgi:ribonuclease HII
MLYYERKLKKKGFDLIVGVDEAGRGPLAGPVVAAAVTLKTSHFKNLIDDSKKLTPRQRDKAFLEIEKKAVFGLGVVSEKIIDHLNILVATRLAMEKAIAELSGKLGQYKTKRIHVLVDGNMGLETKLPVTYIIKGDCKSKSIACASIIAKVTRDRLMSLYDREFPQYGFLRHKGYPTLAHRQAIKRFGPSAIHRNTFCSV